MKIGMIGLGRMGDNTVRRLIPKGHECVVYATYATAVASLKKGRCNRCRVDAGNGCAA